MRKQEGRAPRRISGSRVRTHSGIAGRAMVGAELDFQRYAFLRDIWPLLQEYLPAEFDGTAAL